MEKKKIHISNDKYWMKVVDYLQQNWAVIERASNKVIVYFFDDLAGVFDSIEYEDEETAKRELRWNGFSPYDEESAETRSVIPSPEPPFYESPHWNGPIYSSGRYWRKLPGHYCEDFDLS